jgi:hypothetical protein
MAQVVECLPSKHEALSLNSSTIKSQTKPKQKTSSIILKYVKMLIQPNTVGKKEKTIVYLV